jgi:hypothetical protein
MASGFPGSIDNFTDPLSNSPLTSPNHATLHADVNDAVEKIETYMGLVKVIPTSVSAGSTLSADGTISFTSQSTVSVNGAFTSLYRNYRLVINTGDPATNQTFTMRMRASGSDNSTSNYYRMLFGVYSGGTESTTGAASSFAIGFVGQGSRFSADFSVMSPQAVDRTSITGTGISNRSTFTAITGLTISGWFDGDTQFDGFSLLFGANTTGTIRVYGYRN